MVILKGEQGGMHSKTAMKLVDYDNSLYSHFE